jgi:hypothetical protein
LCESEWERAREREEGGGVWKEGGGEREIYIRGGENEREREKTGERESDG